MMALHWVVHLVWLAPFIVLLPGIVSSEDVKLDPDNPTVCSYETYENTYKVQNKTYECYKIETRSGPCPDGFWTIPTGRRRHYHRRRWWRRHWKRQTDEDFCIRYQLDTCYRLIKICSREVVTKPYCCRGTEPDGKGGCHASIECGEDNGGCDQVCTHDGHKGHTCSCLEGYRLEGRTKCADINECAVKNGGCAQNCTNTAGSFFCACRDGYTRDSPSTCAETNECAVGQGGCEHNCTNTPGSFFCTCEPGFKLTSRFECSDENECEDPIVKKGGCSDGCENVYGDYYCTCPEGTTLDEKGFNCIGAGASGAGGSVPPVGAEPRTLAESMTRPIVLGPIAGGAIFIILLIIIACCCLRKKKRGRETNAEVLVGSVGLGVAVAEKKKGYVEGGVGAGDDKVKAAGNIYCTEASSRSSFSLPPAYEEVICQTPVSFANQGKSTGFDYETVEFSSPPGYEIPSVPATPETPHIYTNMAYMVERGTGSSKSSTHERNNKENERKETPFEISQARNNLKKTGIVRA